jgi:hypothetical protein
MNVRKKKQKNLAGPADRIIISDTRFRVSPGSRAYTSISSPASAAAPQGLTLN